MTATCFVDANILVYSFDDSEPQKQSVAHELLEKLWRERAGRISVQVLNEFYAVATRKISRAVPREEAWQMVEDLLDWNPLPIDADLLRSARAIEVRYKLSWWDSLIVAAARQQNCSTLYTEDLQSGATYEGVRVCNPFLPQVQEQPAEYRVEPISRHRPRGRPRKVA